jgi:AcrR family transcriptional regulator
MTADETTKPPTGQTTGQGARTRKSPSDGTGQGSARPRIEGAREQEILRATRDVLGEVGYDRLTMDAVAARASASKASLYRHYETKAALVLDALRATQPRPVAADTGNLRNDLLLTYGASPGYADQLHLAVLAGVISPIAHDPEFAAAFQRHIIATMVDQAAEIYRRAQARGEARDDLDLEVLAPALASMLLQRQTLRAEPPDPAFIERVVDGLIMPAVAVRV